MSISCWSFQADPHALGAHFAKEETASSVMLSGPIARHLQRRVKAKHLVLQFLESGQ